ncbi:D-alanyl-D-alanine carboxypeptidase/D-alanyl-D-alanine-endopeptidase [Deinococcus deserti]|nr:D-alanyl-D-alanine carboxypeptidase [Deinococcus deserti]
MRHTLALVLLVGGLSAAVAPPHAPADVTLRADEETKQEPALSAGVRLALKDVPQDVSVGVLVRDAGSGQVLEALRDRESFIPASTVKLITASSVLAERGGAQGYWSTDLTIPAVQVGRSHAKTVTLRGSGDPTLSVRNGSYSLRSLARQAYARGLRKVGEVRVADGTLDVDSWQGVSLGVPMTGLRLADWHDDPPAASAEARSRLGAALIAELRQAGVRVVSDRVRQAARSRPYVPPTRLDDQGRALPPDPQVPVSRRPEQGIASVRSASVAGVLARTLRPSDNLRAEELLATLAVRPQGTGTLQDALARERAMLRRTGADLSGVVLADGSGLSRKNRLTPRALAQLLKVMHDLPYPNRAGLRQLQLLPQRGLPERLYRSRQNVFVEALPQAGTGENVPGHDGRGGTLALRLQDEGLDVRAKTGTLPGVSALAGYVTARSGRILVFVVLMNGPESSPILTLRDAQDRLVQALAAAY